MIEIRAVRSEELDAMLAVMCEAFNLPFAPARELFYRDPYFDIEKKRVLVEDGQVVSCLTILDSTLWIGQAPVRVGGVAGVATRLSHRRQGFAGRLLSGTVPVLAAQGYGLAALFPFSYDYYRRLGWERAGTQYRLTLRPASLPSYADARHVRAALPADRAGLRRLYDTYSRHRTGCRLRDERRWSYLLEHIQGRVVYKRAEVEGYALYEMREAANDERQMRLLELVAATEEARRGLAGFLAQQAEVREIEYTAGLDDLRESGLLQLAAPGSEPDGPLLEIQAGPMFRVTDFRRCLEDLRPNGAGLRGVVTLVLREAHHSSAASCAVTVEGDRVSVEVRPGEGGARRRIKREQAGLGVNPRANIIEGDAPAWAQVVTGYHSLRDALALHHLHASSESAAALAAPLFPRRALFLPVADHF